jgi:hypothetical protein
MNEYLVERNNAYEPSLDVAWNAWKTIYDKRTKLEDRTYFL